MKRLLFLPVAAASCFAQDFDYAVTQAMKEAQARMKEAQAVMEAHRDDLQAAQQQMEKLRIEIPPFPPLPPFAPFAPEPPAMLYAQKFPKEPTWAAQRKSRDEDRLYDSGTRALDSGKWDEAVRLFSEAAAAKGTRADGALYWKAYSENRLGQRDTALATIASLRKDYPQSRWLNDAQALEVEIRQQSGKPVNPDEESNEDLKMLALNGLLHSDPDQALPIIDKLLKSNNSPKLKDRALFVLAQNNTPKAQQMLVSIARSGPNPDLQIRAVRYISQSNSREAKQELLNIYNSTPDVNLKRAILRYYLQSDNSNPDGLIQIAKTEKSPELRREAVRSLGVMPASKTGDALVAMYPAEQDQDIRREISNGLFIQHNAKGLVELARKETNPQLKQDLVQKLSNMRSKEATDYLMELLSK